MCPSKLEIRHYFTFGMILIDAQILPLFHGCLLSKNKNVCSIIKRDAEIVKQGSGGKNEKYDN